MNQRRGGGGQAPRQMQRQQPRVDYEKAATDVLGGLQFYRSQLEPVLPSGTTWERFHATIATLLHHNPSILKCTVPSIIRGCMKAAYDGLALDGREAALVPSDNTYGKGENAVTKKEARYNPMVAGLRKQIVQGGLVTDVTVTLVYEGEPYRVVRGTDPRVEHEEIPDCRGPGKKIVGVYSVAWLKAGDRPMVETMSRADVEAVRAMAQTTKVWDKNEGEMYRKTCLRRARKSLPGIQEVRDAEMVILFPEISREQMALPAPKRPDRADYQPARLEAPTTTLDQFAAFDRAAEEVRVDEAPAADEEHPAQSSRPREAPSKTDTKPKKSGKAAAGEAAHREQTSEDDPSKPAAPAPAKSAESKAPEPRIPVPDALPTDEAGWRAYADAVIAALPELPDVDAINAERRAHQNFIDNAPSAIGDQLDNAFADALTDLV